jgi:hypothetical protein
LTLVIEVPVKSGFGKFGHSLRLCRQAILYNEAVEVL